MEGAAYESTDTGVQEQAVFALSQIRGRGGVPGLIRIAKNHPNPRVRRKAIFWLGQSEDPRALEALVEIVKGGR